MTDACHYIQPDSFLLQVITRQIPGRAGETMWHMDTAENRPHSDLDLEPDLPALAPYLPNTHLFSSEGKHCLLLGVTVTGKWSQICLTSWGQQKDGILTQG